MSVSARITGQLLLVYGSSDFLKDIPLATLPPQCFPLEDPSPQHRHLNIFHVKQTKALLSPCAAHQLPPLCSLHPSSHLDLGYVSTVTVLTLQGQWLLSAVPSVSACLS